METATRPALSPSDLRRGLGLVAIGLTITSLAQPRVIGLLPLRLLFKTQLHMSATEQATFLAVSTAAWYFKPLAGLVVDSMPLFGTRRRSYLILTGLLGGVCWLLTPMAHTYQQFMGIMLLLNAVMVIASTVVGGLLVEVGQEGGMTGRLSSLRYGIDNVINIVTGPLGGFLSTLTFMYTASIGAALMWLLVPTTIMLLHEPPSKAEFGVWRQAADQFRIIFRSGTMWSAAGLLFLVFMAPGFQTALYYYQVDHLKFSQQYIGTLQALGGAGGILSSFAYLYFCRRYTLQPLLYGGILLNALSSLLYVGYHNATAAACIDFSNGFFGYLGVMPLFDLATRATPVGCESFAYSLLMSVYNIAVFAIGDPLGAHLYDLWGHDFTKLIWLNTMTSLIALALVPFLPKSMTSTCEGVTPPRDIGPEAG